MRIRITIGLVVGGIAFGTAARAQAPAGALEITGTSTIRDWTCRETGIESTPTAPAGSADRVRAGPKAVSGVTLTFPVGRIDCGGGAMNDRMRKALGAQRYPTIALGLTSSEIGRALAAGAAPIRLDGQLTIAGQTRPVQTQVTVTESPDHGVRLQGEQTLLMSDYGVKPPALLFGMLKARDLVHVAFSIVLRASTLARLGLGSAR